jgi:hypothetical protein
MHEGPSLTLEHDAGDAVAGTIAILEGEQLVLGEAPGAEGVAIRGAGLSRRHLRLTRDAGAWFVADVHAAGRDSARVTTLVNGVPLSSDARALHDGDRVWVQTGGSGVVLVFHDRGRIITGVTVLAPRASSTVGTSSVVTFCPWHRHPSLAYAMREGDERMYTALHPATQWFVARGLARSGALTYVDGLQLVEEMHGVFLGDVVRLSLEEKATMDVAILFEVARLASSVPSGVHLSNRALLTFGGALVWFGEPLGAQSAMLRQGLVHQLLVTLGCEPRVVGLSATETLAAQRDALVDVPLDDASRRALLQVVEVAIDDPARIGDVLAGAAAALGGATAESVRGLLVNLFPNEHARHTRVTEEAQVLGFEGVAALAT